MSGQVMCPQCWTGEVHRSRAQSLWEHFASCIRMAPFHCQQCSHRFLSWGAGNARFRRSKERREYLRLPVRLSLSFSGGKVRGDGIIVDLSLGGCVIKSDTHVHVDDIFYLEIAAPGDEPPIEVAAMVRSVSARGIAFQFLSKAKDNERLLALIQSRSGSASSMVSKV